MNKQKKTTVKNICNIYDSISFCLTELSSDNKTELYKYFLF